LYPTSLDKLVYASQLLQAQAIKYGVEHMRRNRGRCMGALYWQLNDCWPVASWASIDGYGRYKALHYEAKRFFEPIHISCAEIGEYSTRKDITDERYFGYETKGKIFVNNDTVEDVTGIVVWKLCSADGKVLQEGSEELAVKALSYASLEEMDFQNTDVRNNYLSYAYIVDGEEVSFGTVLFTKPKHFNFVDPQIKLTVDGDTITVTASAYAKYLYICNETDDLILSDNFFDMDKGTKTIKILSGDASKLMVKTVYDIR
jgi:beta-mannosidase